MLSVRPPPAWLLLQRCVSNPALNPGLFFKVPGCDFSTASLKYLRSFTTEEGDQADEAVAKITFLAAVWVKGDELPPGPMHHPSIRMDHHGGHPLLGV